MQAPCLQSMRNLTLNCVNFLFNRVIWVEALQKSMTMHAKQCSEEQLMTGDGGYQEVSWQEPDHKWKWLVQVPPTCSSKVVDAANQCCESGVVDVAGGCCQAGAQLDADGACCGAERILDAAGTCGGSAKLIDIQGVGCASGAVDAQGACCQVRYRVKCRLANSVCTYGTSAKHICLRGALDRRDQENGHLA